MSGIPGCKRSNSECPMSLRNLFPAKKIKLTTLFPDLQNSFRVLSRCRCERLLTRCKRNAVSSANNATQNGAPALVSTTSSHSFSQNTTKKNPAKSCFLGLPDKAIPENFPHFVHKSNNTLMAPTNDPNISVIYNVSRLYTNVVSPYVNANYNINLHFPCLLLVLASEKASCKSCCLLLLGCFAHRHTLAQHAVTCLCSSGFCSLTLSLSYLHQILINELPVPGCDICRKLLGAFRLTVI